jgi:hypothetical protein
MMSKQPKKNKPLTLAEVVELKKAEIEKNRQDAMFEAANGHLLDEMYDAEYGHLIDFKLKRARPLSEAEKESALEMRMPATYFWSEVIGVPGATVEEKAVYLATRKAQVPSQVWRKLLLDLVVDITPLDRPVPNTLIALLQDALGLPENHNVGGWPLSAAMNDDRGKPDHEARECASLIDRTYIEAHLTDMPLRELQRRVKDKLGRTPDRTSLREWRKMRAYWGIP